MSSIKLYRFRFKANYGDYRPVKWPIKHPYWCTGSCGEDHSIIVSYGNSVDYIKEYWPEAEEIEVEIVKEYCFSSRFPKPDWFQESIKKETS